MVGVAYILTVTVPDMHLVLGCGDLADGAIEAGDSQAGSD